VTLVGYLTAGSHASVTQSKREFDFRPDTPQGCKTNQNDQNLFDQFRTLDSPLLIERNL